MLNVVPGKEIDVLHTRKGRFSIVVDEISGSILTGTISKGVAHYISQPNRLEGDAICIDTSSPLVELLCESDESSSGS